MSKKVKIIGGIVLVLGIVAILMACLDPLGFDEPSVNISGQIDTRDVTAAVLLLTNRSKTVYVTNVTISRVDQINRINPALTPSISIEDKPLPLAKKAQYLTPSDEEYMTVIDYYTVSRPGKGDEDAFEGKGTLYIPLPLPKQIVEVFIFRNMEGEVVFQYEDMIYAADEDPNAAVDDNDLPPERHVDRKLWWYNWYQSNNILLSTDVNIINNINNLKTPDPIDTGTPAALGDNDGLGGEGSSPAIIAPSYRDRMATFVVIDRTNSQIIDSVRFTQSGKTYSLGSVYMRDKQSIALGQGGWETTLSYTRDGSKITLPRLPAPPLHSIIVPSNDPQATREHYLYFYTTNKGDYSITEDWPPDDIATEDILPADFGYGRGSIRIINDLSRAIIENVTIINTTINSNYQPLSFNFTSFTPAAPIYHDNTWSWPGGSYNPGSYKPGDYKGKGFGYVNVIGTKDCPINLGNKYDIYITVRTPRGRFTHVVKDQWLKDDVTDVVIPDGVDPSLPHVAGVGYYMNGNGRPALYSDDLVKDNLDNPGGPGGLGDNTYAGNVSTGSSHPDSYAYAMAFSGPDGTGNFYAVGDDHHGSYAVFWKDGKYYKLTGATAPSKATSIVISGGTVYIGGYYTNAGKATPCYWVLPASLPTGKDPTVGTLKPLVTNLPAGALNTSYPHAVSIAVYNSNIYAVCTIGNKAQYYNGLAAQWFTLMGDTGTDPGTMATSIFITSGGPVYVTGSNQDGVACTWYDSATALGVGSSSGTCTTISTTAGSLATSVWVDGTVPYITGYNTTGTAKAWYWKQGMGTVTIELPLINGNESHAYSITGVKSGGDVYTDIGGNIGHGSQSRACYWEIPKGVMANTKHEIVNTNNREAYMYDIYAAFSSDY